MASRPESRPRCSDRAGGSLTPAPTPLPPRLHPTTHALPGTLDIFTALHDEQYDRAASLFGGLYDYLSILNPTPGPRDLAALLRLGCTVNGLQCLRARSIGLKAGFTVRIRLQGGIRER
jgi:hypothetical protein